MVDIYRYHLGALLKEVNMGGIVCMWRDKKAVEVQKRKREVIRMDRSAINSAIRAVITCDVKESRAFEAAESRRASRSYDDSSKSSVPGRGKRALVNQIWLIRRNKPGMVVKRVTHGSGSACVSGADLSRSISACDDRGLLPRLGDLWQTRSFIWLHHDGMD